MLDPGNKGYLEPYRTGGKDSDVLIVSRTSGPSTRGNAIPTVSGCGSSDAWYPFCDSVAYGIFVNKGALPHHKPDEFTDDLDINFTKDFLCAITINGQFAYYLYKDKSLVDVCNPGGHFSILSKSEERSETTIYRPKDSYNFEGSKVGAITVSGTTRLTLQPYWESTGSGIGFYKDTSYMQAGGFLEIGPNDAGELSIVKITGIVAPDTVDVTEIMYNFEIDAPVYYWFSAVAPTLPYFVSDGIVADPSGQFTKISTTQQSIELKGGLDTFTIIETFIPIPWAIPAPYSIRNVPHTNIWLRLDDPSIPFNTDTLVFLVNGEDVTEQIQITFVSGGIELFYNPPANFDLSSRVYVEIHISCSPSIYRSFASGAAAGSEFISIDGDLSIFQTGGSLKLGPNPAGDWEEAEVLYMVGINEIKLAAPTQYEYTTGDLVTYTYDDYPVSLNYWFDIVDDFRPPVFESIYPYDGMENVNRQQWIMFDIKDEGLGVDISTLSFTVDNMIVIPQVYKYSDHWYRVVYSPPVQYYYNATVNCFATVMDLSTRQNRAYAVWSFHTESGELPILVNPEPYFCAFPVHHKSHIGVDVFAREAGANLHSMIFTWDQKKYKVITYPKIYRQS
jgi:hypothetical protein